MKSPSVKFATLPILACVLSIAAHGQRGRSNPVEATGCVRQGVEAGCLMVSDKDTGMLYNLVFSSGNKPEVGMGISFTGTPQPGLSACMQGQPIHVKNWVKRTMNCAASEKKKGDPY
ncbi:MAG: hypothetical protein WA738_16825 [Candidatus Angelobacter sp.]